MFTPPDGRLWQLASRHVATSELRTRLVRHVLHVGPLALGGEQSGELATTATVGIEALDGYFARYLPQLVLAVAVPLIVLWRVLPLDATSAITLALTVPLVPLFMALIGIEAQRHTARQWAGLQLLGAHFTRRAVGLTNAAALRPRTHPVVDHA